MYRVIVVPETGRPGMCFDTFEKAWSFARYYPGAEVQMMVVDVVCEGCGRSVDKWVTVAKVAVMK